MASIQELFAPLLRATERQQDQLLQLGLMQRQEAREDQRIREERALALFGNVSDEQFDTAAREAGLPQYVGVRKKKTVQDELYEEQLAQLRMELEETKKDNEKLDQFYNATMEMPDDHPLKRILGSPVMQGLPPRQAAIKLVDYMLESEQLKVSQEFERQLRTNLQEDQQQHELVLAGMRGTNSAGLGDTDPAMIGNMTSSIEQAETRIKEIEKALPSALTRREASPEYWNLVREMRTLHALVAAGKGVMAVKDLKASPVDAMKIAMTALNQWQKNYTPAQFFATYGTDKNMKIPAEMFNLPENFSSLVMSQLFPNYSEMFAETPPQPTPENSSPTPPPFKPAGADTTGFGAASSVTRPGLKQTPKDIVPGTPGGPATTGQSVGGFPFASMKQSISAGTNANVPNTRELQMFKQLSEKERTLGNRSLLFDEARFMEAFRTKYKNFSIG